MPPPQISCEREVVFGGAGELISKTGTGAVMYLLLSILHEVIHAYLHFIQETEYS